jgi:hypothetical protein
VKKDLGPLHAPNLGLAGRISFSTEHPKPNQEKKAKDHHYQTGIEQENKLVPRIELLKLLPYTRAPPQVGNSLALRKECVYLANHDERNHVGKNRGGCHEANCEDDGQ